MEFDTKELKLKKVKNSETLPCRSSVQNIIVMSDVIQHIHLHLPGKDKTV
jgi:hypothetical protein